MLQRLGGISDEEMYQVYNMGVGFCLVVAAAQADRALASLKDLGVEAYRLGHAVADRNDGPPPNGLVGQATTSDACPERVRRGGNGRMHDDGLRHPA